MVFEVALVFFLLTLFAFMVVDDTLNHRDCSSKTDASEAGDKDRPEANPSVIELPDIKPNQSIKITTTIDGRGFDGITYCKWEMQDADGQNCFPKRDTIFSVTIDAKYKRD